MSQVSQLTVRAELSELLPPLQENERQGLEDSIIRHGCLAPLIVWGDILIDGHHRYTICQQHNVPFQTQQMQFDSMSEAKKWAFENQRDRRNISNYVLAEIALQFESEIAAEAKQRQRLSATTSYKGLQNSANPYKSGFGEAQNGIDTRKELATLAGVSHDTIAKSKVIAEKASPEVKEALRQGDATINQVYKDIRRREKEQERETQRQANRDNVAVTLPLDRAFDEHARFSTIVIDPPWDWGDEADGDQLGRARPTYGTMSLTELLELPVGQWSDVNCHLFLWITNRSLPKGFQLLERWGFRYVTDLTWCKGRPGIDEYCRQHFKPDSCSREAQLYLAGYTAEEIGRMMNREESSIRERLYRQGVEMRPRGKRLNDAVLTDRQREIIDGEMLGDGHLACSGAYKNASLRWHQKSLEHTELLRDEFSELSPSFAPRTDAAVGWTLHTACNPDLTVQHARWYKKKTKIVPDDLVLSPLTCFHWYIGDGSLTKSGAIELYSMGFTRAENERLAGMLGAIGVHATVQCKRRNGREYFYLYIGAAQASTFLEYIGPPRVSDYLYKWGDVERLIFGNEIQGLGNYFRGSSEQILFGVKGSLPLKRRDVGTWFSAPRGPRGHSSKPVEFYDLVESCSHGPYLELFARNQRPNWASWGAEVNAVA